MVSESLLPEVQVGQIVLRRSRTCLPSKSEVVDNDKMRFIRGTRRIRPLRDYSKSSMRRIQAVSLIRTQVELAVTKVGGDGSGITRRSGWRGAVASWRDGGDGGRGGSPHISEWFS